jgi:hypothetical protein
MQKHIENDKLILSDVCISLFDIIEAIFIMIESMAEGQLLKSSGQVTCQGQQMFYELLLYNTQYLIKFYDSLGKVRLIRPILLPA